MASEKIAPLNARGVICVDGTDAAKLLQGLITNDIDALQSDGDAIHAGLLSPQGKILFDFFVVKCRDGFLLDVASAKAAELVKRLTMYRLRADAGVRDVSNEYVAMALWGQHPASSGETIGTVAFADPRADALGLRILAEATFAADVASATNGFETTTDAYHAHRVALGVPEGGKDYAFGDAYPHEADFDLFNGVSFTKGCYVGQEVVARMQNKAVVRKRVVKVSGLSALLSGSEIMLGDTAIGRIGSTDGESALAMLRLDRAVEALARNLTLSANGTAIAVNDDALNRYLASVAARPNAPSFS